MPDGKVVGDPASVEFTEVTKKLKTFFLFKPIEFIRNRQKKMKCNSLLLLVAGMHEARLER